MDFQTVRQLATLLSRSFSEDFFRLLVTYQNISASEAASRLNQHIKTAQDFLEGLASLNIVEKKEILEGKRPYFRYTLQKKKIILDFDLEPLYESGPEEKKLKKRIRERKNAGAMFTVAGNNQYISNVVLFIGEGRQRKERKINLTTHQGKFLYHLPFPNAAFLSISDIMQKADVQKLHVPEILDLVDILKEHDMIEVEV
jgi:predicted transcriptional regulator